MLGIHTKDRITVDQNTTEISIQLTRSASHSNATPSDIVLSIDDTLDDITPYAITNDRVFFTIPAEFRTSKYKSGVYKATLVSQGCELDDFEILKASRPSITKIKSNNAICDDNNDSWVEPVHCDTQEKECVSVDSFDCHSCNKIIPDNKIPSVNIGEKL